MNGMGGGMAPPGNRDPMTELLALAQRVLGRQPNDLHEAMDAVWDASPTDDIGAMLEAVEARTGVPAPFRRPRKPEPGGDMDFMQPRINPPGRRGNLPTRSTMASRDEATGLSPLDRQLYWGGYR